MNKYRYHCFCNGKYTQTCSEDDNSMWSDASVGTYIKDIQSNLWFVKINALSIVLPHWVLVKDKYVPREYILLSMTL